MCLYLLDAIVAGEPTRLAQISAVGTRPEWRRRGLNRELTEIALDWARGKHRGVFLFANEDAIPFYERCAFTPIEEFVEVATLAPVPRCGRIVRLDPARRGDLERIHELAKHRAPVSERFAVLNAKLLQFHVLYTLREHVFEIPDLQCLVLHERADGRLRIFDIVGERIPRWGEIYPYLADPGDRSVEFHFFADELGLPATRLEPLSGNHPFVRDEFPVKDPVFPFTCRA